MPDERIAGLAVRQHGAITHGQLTSLGVSTSAISRKLASGWLRRIHRGVYGVVSIESIRAGEMAAVLAGGRSAFLSHTNALGLWGLLRIDPPHPVHITHLGGGRARRAGVVFHRTTSLAKDERAVADGIPVTTPGRTIVDSAGMLGHREVEMVLARAVRKELISTAELVALPERYHGRTGTPMLRSLLSDAAEPHFTRSEAERRCLALLRAAGLPHPHANVPVGAYELDLFWPKENVAIEIDGYEHHSSRVRFEGDRRKDSWLRARGIEVIRLTWRQITQESVATAVAVGQALAWAQARRRQHRGGSTPSPTGEDGPPGRA
ncbi:MAG: type IV toxin-antitoxin system AbiEi family antitoxin domain-containing protein [Gemmatimonadota bacterium]